MSDDDGIRCGNDRHIGIVGIAEFAVVEAVATAITMPDEVEAIRRPESILFNLPSHFFYAVKKEGRGRGRVLLLTRIFFEFPTPTLPGGRENNPAVRRFANRRCRILTPSPAPLAAWGRVGVGACGLYS